MSPHFPPPQVFPEDEGHWAPDAPGMRLALDLEATEDAPPAAEVVADVPPVKDVMDASLPTKDTEGAKVVEVASLPVEEYATLPQEESNPEHVKPSAAAEQPQASTAPSPQQQQQVEANGAVVQVVVVRGSARKHDVEPIIVAAPSPAAGLADPASAPVFSCAGCSPVVGFRTGGGMLPATEESGKRRAAGFFKQLFKGCLYPGGQKWETTERA